MLLGLLGAVALVGIAYWIYRETSDAGFPPSSGKLGGDRGLRPPR